MAIMTRPRMSWVRSSRPVFGRPPLSKSASRSSSSASSSFVELCLLLLTRGVGPAASTTTVPSMFGWGVQM